MEQPEKKLNLQISKYYAEHACQLSSTNEVAILLDLPASRVSELRHGRRQLTVAEAEKIKEIYGLPSASKGHWMECEHLSSENIHKQFIDNGLALHFLQIIETIKSEEFIKPIVECCYFIDQSVPGYRSTSGLHNEVYQEAQKENDKIIREYKLKYFNELLASDSFQAYCDSENTDMAPDFLNSLCAEINPNFGFHFGYHCASKFFKLFRYLRRLREIYLSNTYANLAAFDQGFSVGGRCKINMMTSPNKEHVIIGKVVWELGSENPLRLTRHIANRGVCGLQADEDCLNFSRSLNPKTFTHYSLKLYYSELYKYFLQVNLFEDGDGFKPPRKVLVEISERQKIFEELVDLFNYFQIETGWALKQIKYAVAQNGGYIPGAIYLD